MKKILMLAALPLIILMFGTRSYAVTNPYNNEEYNYEYYWTYQNGYGWHMYSDVKFGSCTAKLTAFNSSDTNSIYCNTWVNGVKKLYCITTTQGTNKTYYSNQVKDQNGNDVRIWLTDTSQGNIANGNSSVRVIQGNGNGNVEQFTTGEALQNYLDTPEIDFETIYYNPQIPVPKLNIWYLYQVESYREDGVANFCANIDVPDSTNFYVELAWKYSYPQQIRCYTSDAKGTPAYDYEYYQSSDLIPIYSLQDMQESINLHISGSDLQTEWQAAYDEFIEATTFYTNQTTVPTGWLANTRLKYVNTMGTQIPLYGNRLEVFARYWTLTEDNQVVVGKWYHWQSAKGSATEDVPETYVNYQELPGYAGTVEDVPTGDESTYTGTGESTGEQATTIINYAPNYPDYPTAVSYNHDNILLQMIQTSKQLPQFFGQFTNFLAITLAFIDPGVWAIIGFGFTCCIVIMIIKVL